MKFLDISHRGIAFTLIELLVVISIIGILAALAFPVIDRAIMRARMFSTLNNGKAIYHSLLAVDLRNMRVLPASEGDHSFDNSTDYWKWAVTNRYLDVTFDAFSAYGLQVYGGLDPELFTPDMNAWCVVADLTESDRSMVPVMFTRNLELSTLSDPIEGALTENPPFAQRGVVVVTKDGRAVIHKEAGLAEYFNPSMASNVVLRP